MSTFDNVSGQYQRQALVQQAAAEKLLAMVNIGANDDVLDVACGPGHITQPLERRSMTRPSTMTISGSSTTTPDWLWKNG